MGFILDDILLAPCKAVAWIGKTLLDLQMQFERDEISEDEYVKQEDALMQELGEMRKRKESGQKR